MFVNLQISRQTRTGNPMYLFVFILFFAVIYQLKPHEHGVAGHRHRRNHHHSRTGSSGRASGASSASGGANGSGPDTSAGSSTAGRQTRAVYLAALDDSGFSSGGQAQERQHNQSALPPYLNDQPAILDHCCACDEAKYELVFEGLWSRYTHPDDFPENYWLAHFSDIIGASHSNEFVMWNGDTPASEGVKELAETGSTKKLESELKQVSSKTRTIIKARELRYPTLNSKTSAVFRTDRQHHLVSVLSKLGPSPDWMVGVSSLELCQADCSWATQRLVNLYLWDAGTDSGTTFTAPDSPTRPQERVHPFKKAPNVSTQSPANSGQQSESLSSSYTFDGSNYRLRSFLQTSGGYGGGEMVSVPTSGAPEQQQSSTSSSLLAGEQSVKPFARLTITRQRIYEKSCNGDSVAPVRHPSYQPSSQVTVDSWTEPTRSSYSDCRFTDWSDWSSCSSTCGKGIRTRTRAFVDSQAASLGCSQVDLIEKEVCLSECVGNSTCATRDWSDWSKCSVNCGQGYRKRTRSPIGTAKRACESVEFVQVEPCTGPQGANCTADPSQCDVSEWSQWSECSVACGRGTRIRTRQYARKESAENCTARLIQKQSCTGRPELCRQTQRGAEVGTRGANQQQSPSMGVAHELSNPNLPVIDCKLSAWSPWSTCSALCGMGRRSRSRYIIQMPQNGGKPCDKKLSRTQRCKELPPCPSSYNAHQNPPLNPSVRHPNRDGHNNHRHGAKHQSPTNQSSASDGSKNWRPTTTSTTTAGSSMMDDEDDNEDRVIRNDRPCKYGNWSQWSECEVVCQPVKKGSNKVRNRVPIEDQGGRCQPLEELYYCDPNIYC